ncbi:MAG: hypothetical protein V1706_09475 [Pseudomonadota bacterium]
MKKISRKPHLIATFSTLLLFAALLHSPLAHAKAEVIAIGGMNYNVNATLEDNLKLFTGKKISVTLASGKNLAGFVKGVGDHLLHLEKLDGNDFSDALIRIENIEAFDARFREFQR